MMTTQEDPRRRFAGLYAIADRPDLATAAVAEAEAAEASMLALLGERPAGAGPKVLQLRAKGASTAARLECLRRLAGPAARAGVLLIVNDDVDAAIDGPPEVAGVHLGQGDLGDPVDHRDRLRSLRERARVAGRREFVIGVSTHSVDQAVAAAALPIDYLGFGPIFATDSKADHDPVVGLAGLAAVALRVRLPIIAIGGLDAARGVAACRTGATAAAMIRALVRSSPGATQAHVAALARALELAAWAHARVVP